MNYADGHPDLEVLSQYGDHQLAEADRTTVERHLRTCDSCQAIFEGLIRGRSLPEPTPPPFSELLSRLPASLQPDATGEALKRRVELELTPYVGAAAAGRILGAVSDDGENLLSTIEPVLRLFLGRSAAGHLVSRIVDRAIVRP